MHARRPRSFIRKERDLVNSSNRNCINKSEFITTKKRCIISMSIFKLHQLTKINVVGVTYSVFLREIPYINTYYHKLSIAII